MMVPRTYVVSCRLLQSSLSIRSLAGYSKRGPRGGKKKKIRKEAPKLEARPPNDLAFEPTLKLPDREKEQELGQLQSQVSLEHKSGNYSQALKLAEQVLSATQEHFGESHPATASAYNNRGLFQKHLGNFDGARKSYTQAKKLYGKLVGKTHQSYANTLHNLGNLNKIQVHLDSSLSATDRLSLLESSIEFLEQAYAIRRVELGDTHPLTINSQSSLGATLSMRILQHYKLSSTDSRAARYYVSMLPSDITETSWNAAEEHLRQALATAIANPRGRQLDEPRPIGTQSKKKTKTVTDDRPTTLTAATAAHNLAVVLKTWATTFTPPDPERLAQAKDYYEQALHVQTQLLSESHPDLYTTKFSLAELLELSNETEQANALRQEIIDTYDDGNPVSAPENQHDAVRSKQTTKELE